MYHLWIIVHQPASHFQRHHYNTQPIKSCFSVYTISQARVPDWIQYLGLSFPLLQLLLEFLLLLRILINHGIIFQGTFRPFRPVSSNCGPTFPFERLHWCCDTLTFFAQTFSRFITHLQISNQEEQMLKWVTEIMAFLHPFGLIWPSRSFTGHKITV